MGQLCSAKPSRQKFNNSVKRTYANYMVLNWQVQRIKVYSTWDNCVPDISAVDDHSQHQAPMAVLKAAKLTKTLYKWDLPREKCMSSVSCCCQEHTELHSARRSSVWGKGSLQKIVFPSNKQWGSALNSPLFESAQSYWCAMSCLFILIYIYC